MPIRPELRHLYRGSAWRFVRAGILGRAQGKCEWCAKPNQKLVFVTRDGTGRWNRAAVECAPPELRIERGFEMATSEVARAMRESGLSAWRCGWRGANGERESAPNGGLVYAVRVTLTTAHLNHVAGDDRKENLAALCQRCHLVYDIAHHRDTRAVRKDGARPLLRDAW